MNQLKSLPKRLSIQEWQKVNRMRWRQAAIEEWKSNPKLGVKAFAELSGASSTTFWRWRKRYMQEGMEGLLKSRVAKGRRITPEIEQKILELRREPGWGHQRIQMYLKRYLSIQVSSATVWNVLKRNNMPPIFISRYGGPLKRRMKRYEKSFPGETVQMDVKFVKDPKSPFKRFYQFTAIDDCTRYRVLRLYARNTTRNAIDFLDQVKKAFPAAIQEIQTDHGPEFATEFTFHLDDEGIRHRTIRPRTPRLNGKVERSHRTDVQEFYSKEQFSDIEDMRQKLSQWEHRYNKERAHMALGGQTPAEKLQTKLLTDSLNKQHCS